MWREKNRVRVEIAQSHWHTLERAVAQRRNFYLDNHLSAR